MMNYMLLGTLPMETVEFFRDELLKRKVKGIPYQWIMFDMFLHKEFLKIFENTELEVQFRGNQPIQKGFYSDPGHGFRIHKDGTQCKTAFNIALSCNDDDWVRWYDDDYINSIGKLSVMDKKYASSRNVDIMDYENVPFIEERRNKVGDVYLVNTDVYHSFKCAGPEPRLVLQTKFEGFPDIDTVYNSLKTVNFKNIKTTGN
jgi:hypothetical protein